MIPAKIIKGDATHAAEVIDIVFTALRSFGIEPSPERWEAEIVAFGNNASHVHEYVAVQDERVVGLVVLEECHEAMILRDLYVDDRTRGQGIGRALLEHAVSIARANGFRLLKLETREAFTAAVRLYESTGWERGPDLRGPDDPPEGPDRGYFLRLTD